MIKGPYRICILEVIINSINVQLTVSPKSKEHGPPNSFSFKLHHHILSSLSLLFQLLDVLLSSDDTVTILNVHIKVLDGLTYQFNTEIIM